jgi:hypothetical protein
MDLFDFRWNRKINDDEWVGLEFVGPQHYRGPIQLGRIRRSALKQILKHVANKRELAWVILDEANRIVRGQGVEDLVIENVDHFMTNAPAAGFGLDSSRVASAIARLDAMDLESVDFKHVTDEVNRMLIGAGTITGAPPPGATYFRVRRNLPRPPTYVSDLSAPAPKFITKFQRCNGPGVPMLYCSDNLQAALREVGAEVGETVYLSVWSVCRPFVTFSMPPGRAPTQEVTAFKMLASYIHSKFTERIHEAQSSRYKITAAFASLYARGHLDPSNPQLRHPLAGVYYRSVADPCAENVAIEAKQAASCMRFFGGFELKVTNDLAGSYFIYEVSATAKGTTDYGAHTLRHVLEWRQDDELGRQILLELTGLPIATNLDFERMIFRDLFDED